MPYKHTAKGPGDVIRSADWNEMGSAIEGLESGKLDRAGGDTVAGPLAVRGDLAVGAPNAGAAVRVTRRQEDGADLSHGALVVGTDSASSASLRVGYASGYSWLQGQGRRALALNPRGGEVGVGTDAPKSPLSVAGGMAVGPTWAAAAAAPAGGVIVEGNLGVGTQAPQARLHVAAGDLRIDAGREIVFADNGQIRSADDNHRILFRRAENKLELRELGDIVFSPGATAGKETAKVVLKADGRLGVGTAAPRAALDTGAGVMTGAAMDYIQGQFTMSGGGYVTWTGDRLKWTQRFIAIPVGRPGASATGHVNVHMPQGDLPAEKVWTGQPRSVSGDGILLAAWEALYAVHATGGNEQAVSFRIVQFQGDFSAPSNWLLVAAVNGDDGSVRLGTGQILARGRGHAPGTRRAREMVTATNSIRLPKGDWVDMPNMQLAFDAGANPVLLLFKTGGVQMTPGDNNARGRFRMMLDGGQVASMAHEFHNNGWELRDVTLVHLGVVTPGSHTVKIQWKAEGSTLSASWYDDNRTLIAVEL